MQSTHAPGANMCGIILPDGSDCLGPIPEEAPLNLCAVHLIEAATWVNRNDETTRPRTRCTLCGEREARQDPAGGIFCGRCGYQSPDFEGTARLTAAEQDETHPIRQGRRPVHVVYYIRFGDRVKIGTTRNPHRRMTELPHDEILAFEPGGIHLEAMRHLQFRESCIRGTEWFHVTPELLAHAAEMRGEGTAWDDLRRINLRNDTPKKAA
ncbi:GIY-YIG nuclease family protein [Microbacterium sp. PAMC21962]|uniref:GIY-YIG nuclease family protein n=1 Tax=Microbacterium sp. PAMC21962 TaxID=2861280 RepID=UPI001C6341F2|nr:GIY-YIG nuclease family protein [Microbacterium sp. PAMC21962]QYF98466.1 GIY-YIG nuclease family protein [Microbacterium sp. PAMC21962]